MTPSSTPPPSASDRLRLLVESVVGYAIITLDVDGDVASWNPGAERLTGYAAADIVGRHLSTFFVEEDLAAGKPARELAAAVVDGSVETQGWRVRRDGTRFWADVVLTALRDEHGELVGFGKVTRDLTERKRAEDELRSSEERFRLLVASVVDYAIFMLDPDGHVASWNSGAERLKGYTADEIIGQHFSRFYTGDDRAAGRPALMLETAERDGRAQVEGWRVRKDGSRFWADVVITALRTPDGDLRGFAKVTRDLTERKRTEDARRDLAAIVAHDLRSPMAVIAGLTGLLLDEWDRYDDDERRDVVTRVDRTVAGLRRVIDDLLDVARLEAGELHFAVDRIDLAALARRAADDLASPEERSRIEIVADDDGPWAVGDDRRTWQVLSNLVSNALLHGGDGPVRIAVRRDADGVRVEVRDRGPGIQPERLAHVFDRYARGAARGSTGLGLHIARSFVEAQGGEIGVESTPGAGSTFWFRLPA